MQEGQLPEPGTWEQYRDILCKPVEEKLLGFAVRDKERLISAIISNARLNEGVPFPELKEIGMDTSLETEGDFILDFAIFDNFALKGKYTAKEIDDFRQFYGGNEALHVYAKEQLRLQEVILWGPDEETRQVWDQPSTTLLADRLEMLIAIVYLEKGIDGVKRFLETRRFFEEMDKIKRKFLK
jgi:dsRNA-specific ribonuclease